VDAVTLNPYFEDKVEQAMERVAHKRKLDLDDLSRIPSQVSTERDGYEPGITDVMDGRAVAVSLLLIRSLICHVR